jgi:transposase InsO family protein
LRNHLTSVRNGRIGQFFLAVLASPFKSKSRLEAETAPGSPWQNSFAERLIGSIRRECVDRVIVLGETHLRRILTKYASYYNELKTHRSLNKDAPIHRAIQHLGGIVSTPILSDLHHQYCRI